MTCEWCNHETAFTQKAKAYTYADQPIQHGFEVQEWEAHRSLYSQYVLRCTRNVKLCGPCLAKLEPMTREQKCPRCGRWHPAGAFQPPGVCPPCASKMFVELAKEYKRELKARVAA